MTLTRRQTLAMLAAAAPLPAWQSFYYGKDVPLPRPIQLTAGEMTMVFEPELGFLRYLRFGDTEIIRGIYAAVRDQNWGTVAPRISKLRVETTPGAFQLSFDVECKQGNIDFVWHGEITGSASSAVTFRMEGDARSTFLRNRIGFCVLHPLEGCAGKPCTVSHSTGTREAGKFPLAVAPNQPFKDMTSVSHQVAPGVMAEVRFEGETFEMEDHRNWTDASYKTYCTPLEKPYPVEVKQGARITQSVTVKLDGVPASRTPKFMVRRKEIALDVLPGQVSALPKIGVGVSADASLTAREAARVKAAGLAHLRVDSRSEEQWKQALSLGLPLEVALHLGRDAEKQLQSLAAKLKGAKVARYLIYHEQEKSTSAKWAELAKRHLPGVAIGGGTNAYFAELNRERPPAGAFDFLCFSLNPQVHAFDNASLVENAAAQADVVQSARQFAAGKGIVVTPVTFKPRFNPNATAAETKLPPHVLPPQVDPRQLSLFGAAWTLASIKYLAESGATSVTYYETVGAQGILERDRGPQWPKDFPSKAGQVFPLYHVLAGVNLMTGGEVLRCRSSEPLSVEALVQRKGNAMSVTVSNLTAEAQAVRLTWPGAARRVSVRKLDEHTVKQATESPESFRSSAADEIQLRSGVVELTLAAYGTAFLTA